MYPADPIKRDRIEEFLRKSLLGEEVINTQLHLFSARSSQSGRVIKPRVLCANNALLAKSSKYFLDLLSSDINPSGPLLSDLTDDNDMPNNLLIDEYGYASDSDLDDDKEDPSPPIIKTEAQKHQPATGSTTPSQINLTTRFREDDELSDDGSGSVNSDMFVMSPEHPRLDEQLVMNLGGARSVASSETAIQETPGNKTGNPHSAAMRLRSLGSRHVLVKDTAFQTWYILLNYLYTGKISFLPLSSAAAGGQPHTSSTSSLDEPQCSAKSMYHLACKVGLDQLRNEALAHIRNNLSEHNILKELSCSLVSRHPELLEMELDVLYAHIASPPVMAGFPALAHYIALGRLPHGAEIIVWIHTRVLEGRPPGPSPSTATLALESSLIPPPPASSVFAISPLPWVSNPELPSPPPPGQDEDMDEDVDDDEDVDGEDEDDSEDEDDGEDKVDGEDKDDGQHHEDEDGSDYEGNGGDTCDDDSNGSDICF